MGRMPQGPNGEYLSPNVQYIRPHHRHIARLAVAGLGPTDIATVTGFTPGQISRILGSPAFQTYLGQLEDRAEEESVDMRKDLMMMAQNALANLDEDLSMEPGDNLEVRKVRQKASLDILDRLGLRKQQASSIKELHLHKHDHDEVHVHDKSDEELYSDITSFLGGKRSA